MATVVTGFLAGEMNRAGRGAARSPARRLRWSARTTVAALLAVLAACGGGGGGGASDATTSGAVPASTVSAQQAASAGESTSVPAVDTSVATLSVAAVTTVAMGTPATLTASALDAKGATLPGATVAWTLGDPSIATVDATGRVTPLRAGFTTLTATAGRQTASGILSVRGPIPVPVRSEYVGTNLGGISYYGSNFPFADLVKSGGGWGPSNADGSATAFPGVTADGYPTSLLAGQRARIPVAWSGVHYPAGRYTLLWDGKGTLSFPLSRIRIDETGANRMVVESTDASASIWLSIDTTDPTDPVHNVRFLMPGTEATYLTQPFNPAYLQQLAPFSLVRFMDWGKTNGSPVVEWADRSLPADASYTGAAGVPVEVMIDLANTLHVDPWFCIPHQASDDYVRQFATLLHTRLDPTLRPHIEYSNEMWNWGFSQTGWAVTQSDAQGLARPWGTPSIFYARRAVQIFKLLQATYGAADAHRLVRVIAGQAAWTQFLENALGDADTAANADVMAVAPYFTAEAADNAANLAATLSDSPDQIVDQFLVSIRGKVQSWMTANATLATRYHLALKAYESGPGDTTAFFPAANQDALTALFSAANASPRMKDVYTEYYGQWKAAGGSTMNQFSDVSAWSKWGFWGALQYVTQDPLTSPKYQGLISFIGANPTAPAETVLGSPAFGIH